MFTCCIRYVVDLEKLSEFREYAAAWMTLIEKYGGIHHGYFMPGEPADRFPEATFSFPGLGINGPENSAVALFSFPNIETYEVYRRDVVHDETCKAITARFNETKHFRSYERNFLVPFSTRANSNPNDWAMRDQICNIIATINPCDDLCGSRRASTRYDHP